MPDISKFEFFDPHQDYFVTYGDLPHWEQPGATYFITFRTADSLPQEAFNLWKRQRDHRLTRQTGIVDDMPWHIKAKALDPNHQGQFRRIFRHKLEKLLDRGTGECPFSDAKLAQIVADSLKHFDGERYHLGDFVVMPNHVHLLVCLFAAFRLRRQCYSWKHYIAKEINKIRGGPCELWQKESFDHLVRDVEHFRKFQRYIRANPKKAGLAKGRYLLYEADV